MAQLVQVYADSHMDSRKRKGVLPLPYLIRPRRIMPPLDTFGFYNDDDDESDEDKPPVEAMETLSLNEGNCFGLEIKCDASLSEMDYSLNDEKDEEYVVVDNAEALSSPKTERAGAIQIMELSKDMDDDESISEVGSNSGDEWVVV